MADSKLEGNYPVKALYQALEVEPNTRPLISNVVTALRYLAMNKEVDEDVDNESDSESALGLEFSSYSCTTSHDRRSDIGGTNVDVEVDESKREEPTQNSFALSFYSGPTVSFQFLLISCFDRFALHKPPLYCQEKQQSWPLLQLQTAPHFEIHLNVFNKEDVYTLVRETLEMIKQNIKQIWFSTLWLAIHVSLFIWKFNEYKEKKPFDYQLMNYCIGIAKGSVETLKFNIGLI
uniref:Uncharacterized protein n=1 Tax=Cucumis melo TaxID=3656 RepID=A0A9I9E5G6_CUCME